MKKIEEIEEEYKSFPIESKFVTSLDEFQGFIQVGIDDIEDAQADYKKELRENHLWQIEAKLRNIVSFIFQQEEEQLYEYDSDILKQVIVLTEQYKRYYQKLLELSNDQNYLELTKLVDFIADYYGRHMDYFQFLRDQLDAQAMGFNLYNPKMEDNREVVSQFMEFKLSQIQMSGDKPLQYVKREKVNG